jgi:hypothetical protein
VGELAIDQVSREFTYFRRPRSAGPALLNLRIGRIPLVCVLLADERGEGVGILDSGGANRQAHGTSRMPTAPDRRVAYGRSVPCLEPGSAGFHQAPYRPRRAGANPRAGHGPPVSHSATSPASMARAMSRHAFAHASFAIQDRAIAAARSRSASVASAWTRRSASRTSRKSPAYSGGAAAATKSRARAARSSGAESGTIARRAGDPFIRGSLRESSLRPLVIRERFAEPQLDHLRIVAVDDAVEAIKQPLARLIDVGPGRGIDDTPRPRLRSPPPLWRGACGSLGTECKIAASALPTMEATSPYAAQSQ